MKLSKTRYLNSLSVLSSFHTTSSYRQLPLKSKEMKRKKRGTWVLKKEKESVQTLMYGKPTFGYSMKIWYTLYKNRPCILFIRVVVTHKYVRSTEANIFAHGIFTEKNIVTGKLTFIRRYSIYPLRVLAYYRNFLLRTFVIVCVIARLPPRYTDCIILNYYVVYVMK